MIQLVKLDFSCVCTARYKHTFNDKNLVLTVDCACRRTIKLETGITDWGLSLGLILVKQPSIIRKKERKNFLKINEIAVLHSSDNCQDNAIIFKSSNIETQSKEVNCNCGKKLYYSLGMNIKNYSCESKYDTMAVIVENKDLFFKEIQSI